MTCTLWTLMIAAQLAAGASPTASRTAWAAPAVSPCTDHCMPLHRPCGGLCHPVALDYTEGAWRVSPWRWPMASLLGTSAHGRL
jgi:hypothetical protein